MWPLLALEMSGEGTLSGEPLEQTPLFYLLCGWQISGALVLAFLSILSSGTRAAALLALCPPTKSISGPRKASGPSSEPALFCWNQVGEKVCSSCLTKAGVQEHEMSVWGAEDPLRSMFLGPALANRVTAQRKKLLLISSAE